MRTKSTIAQIKMADDAEGEITAYASTFDREPDSYGDVVAKGAFAESLEQWKESGNRIPLLYGHQMDDPMKIIGTVTDAEEDEHGLLIHAVFDMGTEQSEAAHKAVLNRTLSKLSFAFDVLDEGTVELEDGRKANELRKLNIHEVSLVIVPANSHAEVIEAKSDAPDMVKGGEDAADDKATYTEADEEEEEATEAKPEQGEEPSEPNAEPDTEAEAATQEEGNDSPTEDDTEPSDDGEDEEKEGTDMDTKSITDMLGDSAEGAAKPAAKTLGEIAAKSVESVTKGDRFSVSAKASSDIHTIGNAGATTDYDRNVYGVRPMSTIADLFASETISGNALTYYVEGAAEGSVGIVAEGGAKPQIHLPAEAKTVPLKKVAAFLKESDEIIEDAQWMATAINNRGVYMLQAKEAAQLATDLLATSGIQTMSPASPSTITVADIKKAKTKVQEVSGMIADAVLINPADYDAIVLGSLTEKYSANPWSAEEPRLWGMTVCQSSDIAAGTCVVGAFKQCGSVVRKGGVRVESTNSNDTDFQNNLVSIRIEERMALAVRIPAGFVKVA